jgi:DNA-binding MarR family transcriptional regulator
MNAAVRVRFKNGGYRAHPSKGKAEFVPIGKQRSPAPNFTPKQGQYLAFIYAYTHVLGQPPAEVDLRRHFGVSPPSVHQMVLTLERAELIRRKPGVARSIEVLVAPELLPVLR